MFSSVSLHLETCQPILIDMPHSNSSNWTSDEHPVCQFWNETTEQFEGEGCYVYTFDSEKTVCACFHLTFFGVKESHFTPEVNMVDPQAFPFGFSLLCPSLVPPSSRVCQLMSNKKRSYRDLNPDCWIQSPK